jgi:hypothetical protein
MFSYLDNKPVKVGSAILPLVALAIYFGSVVLPFRAAAQLVPPDPGGGCTAGRCLSCPKNEEQVCNSDGRSFSACSADACE